MATCIDVFESQLVEKPAAAILGLGLANRRPRVPYDGVYGQFLSRLANIFLRAVIVDRILWALRIGTVEPFTQYIHNDFTAEVNELDMSEHHTTIITLAARFAASQVNGDMEYSNSIHGDNLRCGFSTVKHETLSIVHNVASQLYYAATLFIILGSVSGIDQLFIFE